MSIKQFFTLFLLFGAFAAVAQSPQAFNYQAVVRDAQGVPLSNQTLNFEVGIVQNNAVSYGETQTKTTNQFGLVDIKVGQGTAFQNTFAGINWGNGAAVIRVKVNGVALPESPILSVPYALYALKSGGSAADSWTSVGNNINRVSGNVGIGVANPTSALEVFNSITMSSKVANKWPALIFNNHNNQTKYFEMAPSGEFYLYDQTSRNYDIFFDNNGRVGLGTLKPTEKLHVEGNINVSGAVNSGRLNIDLQRNSGPSGRDGMVIYSSADNKVSSLITNRDAFYFFSLNKNGDADIQAGRGSFSTDISVRNTASVGVLEVRGADIVEKFNSKETIEAGTLVTIDAQDINNYKTTDKAYQKGIVGIVSGANGVKHGMLLEQDDVLAGNTKVAIAGRVYVKATAQNGAIKAGDFLTSSNTAGYAMKSTNRRKAYGAVIGKALTNLESGEGFVLVLVGLQ
jgi:hypothetical protein